MTVADRQTQHKFIYIDNNTVPKQANYSITCIITTISTVLYCQIEKVLMRKTTTQSILCNRFTTDLVMKIAHNII